MIVLNDPIQDDQLCSGSFAPQSQLGAYSEFGAHSKDFLERFGQ